MRPRFSGTEGKGCYEEFEKKQKQVYMPHSHSFWSGHLAFFLTKDNLYIISGKGEEGYLKFSFQQFYLDNKQQQLLSFSMLNYYTMKSFKIFAFKLEQASFTLELLILRSQAASWKYNSTIQSNPGLQELACDTDVSPVPQNYHDKGLAFLFRAFKVRFYFPAVTN